MQTHQRYGHIILIPVGQFAIEHDPTLLRGRIQGDPPLGLHRYIEQYVYYPAVVHLSAFTV